MIVRIKGKITWGDGPNQNRRIIGWEEVDTTIDIDIQELLTPTTIWEAFLNDEKQSSEWWQNGCWLTIEELKIQVDLPADPEHHIWVTSEEFYEDWRLESEAEDEGEEEEGEAAE